MTMKFDELILHPTTRKILAGYLTRPTHALLLAGEVGVGLGTVARTLAQTVAGANYKVVLPSLHNQQKTVNINVDDIRELVTLNRAKRREKFIIIIDEAEKMTGVSPQAFLKILEEPAMNLHFILTTHQPAKLPATILSRTEKIDVLPTTAAPILKNYNRKILPARLQQLNFLAGNLPAEMSRLLADETYFRQVAGQMETAKNFVASPVCARLEIIAENTSRDSAQTLTRNIAKILLTHSTGDVRTADQLATLAAVTENLAANGNTRAQLMHLALNL